MSLAFFGVILTSSISFSLIMKLQFIESTAISPYSEVMFLKIVLVIS